MHERKWLWSFLCIHVIIIQNTMASHHESFAEKVARGTASTASVDQELNRADENMHTTEGAKKYYKLDKALKRASPSTSKSIIARVVSGELNASFLTQTLPILSAVDPALLKFFSQGDGATLLALISTAYTQGRLDLGLLRPLVKSEEARVAMERLNTQYHSGGMGAVDLSDLTTIFTSLDFGAFIEDTKPIVEMLSEIVATRTINQKMIHKHLSALRRVRGSREKARTREEKDAPPLSPTTTEETAQYEESPDISTDEEKGS